MIEKKKTESFIVPAALSGERADVALARFLPGQTRSQIKRLIVEKHVLVDGVPIKPSRKFDGGEAVQVTLPEPRPMDAEPEDIPLNIIYEDDY
ncbi:MAG: S4 domain-containing protein, partial [Thermodesulfobacteriota bacterium]